MAPRELTISLSSDPKIEAISIKVGARKNYDTLVDVRIGPIVILEVHVIDDHLTQAMAYLPSGISVSDTNLEDSMKNAAIAFHYDVDGGGSAPEVSG